jgi:isopentenyl phosphate kinase
MSLERRLTKPLVVIKLGGSALTDKTKIYTPRLSAIHKAAEQISFVQRKAQLILVHGAGSFGHIPAKRYGLHRGFKDSDQIKGLATTKLKLLEWERILDGVFLRHGVHVVPFLASDFAEMKAGRISRVELSPIRDWLHLGCTPIIGGDIVRDANGGFSILSGDQLAAYLAIKLKAKRLVFGLDVDGLFDSNPKLNKQARLLGDVTPTMAMHYATISVGGTVPDVTGGMAGKVIEGVVAARHGVPVYFVSLTKDNRLRKTALGQRVIASSIRPDGHL